MSNILKQIRRRKAVEVEGRGEEFGVERDARYSRFGDAKNADYRDGAGWYSAYASRTGGSRGETGPGREYLFYELQNNPKELMKSEHEHKIFADRPAHFSILFSFLNKLFRFENSGRVTDSSE